MSDVQALDSSGNPQPAEAAPAPAEIAIKTTPEVAPFHTWTDRDGKETVFKTPDELNDYIGQGTLRHSDYTQKTQKIAELRKTFEQQQKDHAADKRTLEETYSETRRLDKMLKENPRMFARLQKEQELLGTEGNTDVEQLIAKAIQPLTDELSGYKKETAERTQEKAMSSAYDIVAGKHTDFDRSTVDTAIQRLNEMPEAMRLEAMVEMVYLAERGRMTPGEIERKLAMAPKKPKAVTPTASVGIPDKQLTPLTRAEEVAAGVAALEAVQSG